jgi:hypothetical protein
VYDAPVDSFGETTIQREGVSMKKAVRGQSKWAGKNKNFYIKTGARTKQMLRMAEDTRMSTVETYALLWMNEMRERYTYDVEGTPWDLQTVEEKSWAATVKKTMDVLFDRGVLDTVQHGNAAHILDIMLDTLIPMYLDAMDNMRRAQIQSGAYKLSGGK